jgi:mevalonate kinase
MAMNHHLLNAVGVGHQALSAVVDAAANAQYTSSTGERASFACKLTGAGGGGCAIILSPEAPAGDEHKDAAAEAAREVQSVQEALAALVEKIK